MYEHRSESGHCIVGQRFLRTFVPSAGLPDPCRLGYVPVEFPLPFDIVHPSASSGLELFSKSCLVVRAKRGEQIGR